METLRTDTVHASESICTKLSCMNTEDVDELSKEKEEELLYGAGGFGDEDEALSDDSLRLRVSDDEELELEEHHITSPIGNEVVEPRVNDKEIGSNVDKPAETNQKTSVDAPTESLQENDVKSKESSEKVDENLVQQDQGAGKVSVDDGTVVNDDQKQVKTNGGKPVVSEVDSSKSSSVWQSSDSRWRNDSHNRQSKHPRNNKREKYSEKNCGYGAYLKDRYGDKLESTNLPNDLDSKNQNSENNVPKCSSDDAECESRDDTKDDDAPNCVDDVTKNNDTDASEGVKERENEDTIISPNDDKCEEKMDEEDSQDAELELKVSDDLSNDEFAKNSNTDKNDDVELKDRTSALDEEIDRFDEQSPKYPNIDDEDLMTVDEASNSTIDEESNDANRRFDNSNKSSNKSNELSNPNAMETLANDASDLKNQETVDKITKEKEHRTFEQINDEIDFTSEDCIHKDIHNKSYEQEIVQLDEGTNDENVEKMITDQEEKSNDEKMNQNENEDDTDNSEMKDDHFRSAPNTSEIDNKQQIEEMDEATFDNKENLDDDINEADFDDEELASEVNKDIAEVDNKIDEIINPSDKVEEIMNVDEKAPSPRVDTCEPVETLNLDQPDPKETAEPVAVNEKDVSNNDDPEPANQDILLNNEEANDGIPEETVDDICDELQIANDDNDMQNDDDETLSFKDIIEYENQTKELYEESKKSDSRTTDKTVSVEEEIIEDEDNRRQIVDKVGEEGKNSEENVSSKVNESAEQQLAGDSMIDNKPAQPHQQSQLVVDSNSTDPVKSSITQENSFTNENEGLKKEEVKEEEEESIKSEQNVDTKDFKLAIPLDNKMEVDVESGESENIELKKNDDEKEDGESKVKETKTKVLKEDDSISLLNENSSKSQTLSIDDTDLQEIEDDSDENITEIEIPMRKKRRKRKMMITALEMAMDDNSQEKESGRQKRKTAKNAEEIIKSKFLNQDSDLESSDNSDKFVVVNHKITEDTRSLSPPTLKRNCPDSDVVTLNGSIKKAKITADAMEQKDEKLVKTDAKSLSYVRKFFQRDVNNKIPKLSQEELEELLLQKIVETITMRGEIGKLREQARISEKNQEATRARCQQLAKQITDLEMVLNRNAADRRANNEKPTPPIKINRSVGLQVNFISEQGMQSLRQLQHNNSKPAFTNGLNTSADSNNTPSPRRGIKVRSPRRPEPSTATSTPVTSASSTTNSSTVVTNATSAQVQNPSPIISSVTPQALLVAKPITPQTPHNSTVNNTQIVSNQGLLLNGGKVTNPATRTTPVINPPKSQSNKPNDLIDLTDEEEKSKSVNPPAPANTTPDKQPLSMLGAKPAHVNFQRVVPVPGNIAISQATSIRVVQPASQPTPTALVNNMNGPRLTYVMQSGSRQLLITSNSNQPLRPGGVATRPQFSGLAYKAGISSIANGTVRLISTPASTNVQLNKHPAPLPDTPNYTLNPSWKLPPPAPSLKISKVANGIVLSWNMTLSDKYADIASYQLYAYQEVVGVPPSTALWKKVGDVRALPLPMACTLTQFSEGNNYYFAVRAVDTHSRKGQYSTPGNISL